MESKPFAHLEKMLKDTVTTNENIAKCDFCKRKALYDGKTKAGVWANMCQEHFEENGVGLGLGLGQQLISDDEI